MSTAGGGSVPSSNFREYAWYPLDGTYADSTGNFGNLSTTGSPEFVTTGSVPWGSRWCEISSVTSEYLTTPSLSPGSDLTIAFYADILFEVTSSEMAANGTSSTDFEFRENVSGEDLDVFTDGVESNATNYYSGSPPTTNFTRHFVVTYDGSTGEIIIYHDGTNVTDGGSETGATGTDLSGTWDIFNGTWGRIKDLRIYDEVLSGTDVSTLYSGGQAKLPE